MPEFQLLRLLVGWLRARLAQAHSDQAGVMTLEVVVIATMLVGIAVVVLLALRSKVQQSVTRITLP